MKIILLIAFCCLLHVNLASRLRNDPLRQSHSLLEATASCCVQVWEDKNYSGATKTFCSTQSNLKDYGWNDRISSFKVGSECSTFTIYQAYGYGGNERSWKGGDVVSNLKEKCMEREDFAGSCTASWNDRITSFVLKSS